MLGIPSPYAILGGLGLWLATAVGAFAYGRHVESDHNAAVILAAKDQLRETSQRDERLMTTMAGTLGTSLATALNQGDRTAAPIILGMHDALRSTPLAVDVRCVVPDGVRDQAALLHRAAERAADAADAAGEHVGR